LNTIFLWIIHFVCVHRSWNRFQTIVSKSPKSFNTIFVLHMAFSCVCRSSKQLKMFPSNWAKCLNKILLIMFVWNIHCSCIRRLWNQLRLLLRIASTIWIESYYELFISRAFLDHVLNSKSLVDIKKIFQYNLNTHYSFVMYSSIA
jgi:hypothetical protein